ncbi:MAG: TlpA disulfide reductase family protein [Gammaproteobacteria bacterium]|nr:TlpA disulfide reductase family protein [Gammaproteobacteria bacterium]
MTALPAFSLADPSGTDHAFPTGSPTVVTFVKEDCPTCNLVMPLLDALQASGDVPVLAAGQTAEGNRVLLDRHGPTFPLLDDSILKVSFAYDVETVPLVLLADGEGGEVARLVGFDRSEWQAFFASHAPNAAVDWDAFPKWRPGCGSLTQDPIIAERLRAESENSPLRARRIDIAPSDDVHEFMFDQGFTDGLPVVPPTPERVLRMLSGTGRSSQEVVAEIPPNYAPATVEKIAVNAVLAGCRAEYLPVIIAAIEAICTKQFNIHGVNATTMGASPVLVVNGPIRERIGMNMRLGVLGQGTRANAAIGRAVRLAVRNIGGAKPGGTERSTLGNPMKFTMCFPEWEERSPWEAMHVERGFDAEDSVVTAFAMSSGPALCVDQSSRTARQLAGSFALSMEAAQHVRAHGASDTLLVVSPEHVDTLWRDRFSKDDIREHIQRVTARPLADLVSDDDIGGGIPRDRFDAMDEDRRNRRSPKFASKDNIHIVVAGAEAGKFSGVFHGWAGGEIGSIPVSRKIEE